MQHRGAFSGLGWMGWMHGSLGGVRYRAPYSTNNYANIVLGLLFIINGPNVFFLYWARPPSS